VVIVRDVPVATMCPHHLMPSAGYAVVAFAPREMLVGFGAISRVVAAYSKRLALQEQIGQNVVQAIDRHLAPRWVACRIVLTHSCMRTSGGANHEGPVESVAAPTRPWAWGGSLPLLPISIDSEARNRQRHGLRGP
jgi:GTP cyclohydrolase I